MSYETGQQVIVSKNLGRLLGTYFKKKYKFGKTIEDIPLGSKGTISNIYKNKIYLILNDGTEFNAHSKEIRIDEVGEKKRKEDLKLEEVISSNVTEEETIEHSFNSKFNIREEYAFWVRKEFLELKEHAEKEKKYKTLEKRKEEVLEGADKAFEHGKKTMVGCAFRDFMQIYEQLTKEKQTSMHYFEFKTDSKNFATKLEKYVSFIEFISPNFKNNIKINGREKHHGIKYESNGTKYIEKKDAAVN